MKRVVDFVKPYVLKMHFSNRNITAQVVRALDGTVACAVCTRDRNIRDTLTSKSDVAAAAEVGKILGQRLLFQQIPAVSVDRKRGQRYHGKLKALIDAVGDKGVNLI
eukprot:TRINITY_DN10196_c0_g1_i1.p1 TRINITY_DN10196_c0_g1~~TRINITY_DN10196_c0_g1_i1.p1  ORF type:complete len:107 (+),score=3.72 TRINITY_DN10196_c0_g1_i1:314-634(+)